MLVNDTIKWDEPKMGGCTRLHYTIAHEFGHTLGLPDFYSDSTTKNVLKLKDALMHSGTAIHAEDIAQLKAIYLLHEPH